MRKESPKQKLNRLRSEQSELRVLRSAASGLDLQVLDICLGIIAEQISWAESEVAK